MFTIQKEHLMVFMTVQSIITVTSLLHTSKNSWYRSLNILCIALLSFTAYTNSSIKQEINGSALPYQILGAISSTAVLQTVNLLLIAKIDSADLDRIRQLQERPVSRTMLAIQLVLDARIIGTPWQPPKIPCFPPALGSSRPSRLRFLVVYSAVFAWKYLLLDFVIAQFGTPLPTAVYHYRPELHFLSLDAANMEWTHRLLASLVMWSMLHHFIDLIFLVLGLINVGLGLIEADRSPPLFGRIQDAYTIRKFWNTYWHQMLRWPITAWSRFITRDVLRLPSPSLVERYLNIGLAFFLSGVVHEFATATIGMPYSEAGSLTFFSLFVVGIMIEDGVQAVYSWMSNGGPPQPTPLWIKIIGYIWVILWFTLTTPGFTYDLIHTFANSPKLLPHRVTESLGTATAGSLLLVGGLALRATRCIE
ncbi:membrane bound O-acyl transferase family-domain-containing protein [Aspergillus pseudoustus]|uniref:Membrane bound O-acyl transferase family-domain-containing protein n=1 Tax=Aspergillus pseudoustus TaxID=1810923 RepID=A0ABR4J3T4_9EURO